MQKGFTLIELMVVIAILVILMALTVPVGKSMIVSNQIASCSGNLFKICQAMKLYYADYQGVPPVWIAEDGGDAATPYNEMLSTGAEPVDPGTGAATNPLMALYREGYLKSKDSLHCPADREHRDGNSPTYYYSYSWRQADNTDADKLVKITYLNDQDNSDAWNNTEIPINRFKYMPCRIFTVLGLDSLDPGHAFDAAKKPTVYTEQRELANKMRSVTVGGNQYWGPVSDSSWMPADSTIVTWCDYHANIYTKNGVGQYQVLYWDGSVVMKSRTLFEKGKTTPLPPPAAWEVAPSDQ